MKGMDWKYISGEKVVSNLNDLSMELIRSVIESSKEGAGDQIRGMLKLIDAVKASMVEDDDA